MRYLMCLLNKDQTTTYDYTVVDTAEEEKISSLMQSKELPDEWDFKGKRIVTDTILGFTDKPLAHDEPSRPKITSFDELREWVHQQEWYKKNRPKTALPDTEVPTIEQEKLLEFPPQPDVRGTTDLTRF